MSHRVFLNKRELIEASIQKGQVVLDVGYVGQGIKEGDAHWVHGLILDRTDDVYGVDLEPVVPTRGKPDHYQKASAEQFTLPVKVDRIVAADLIEHLSNPGLFLDACKKTLKPDGQLILTTPNCFNLFNIAEKFMKDEPTVNSDHTCYFNRKTLVKLLQKNGWTTVEVGFVYDMGIVYEESFKKQVLNFVYKFLSKATPKYLETLVIVAKPDAVPLLV